jgi:hypothetical protein
MLEGTDHLTTGHELQHHRHERQRATSAAQRSTPLV